MAYFAATLPCFRLVNEPAVAWRQPQIGALGAILAHWSLSGTDPAVVSMANGVTRP